MSRYNNKWDELPPVPINPRKWGFDPQKGWAHEVSPAFKKAYTESRLEQLEIEEGPLKEDDAAWLNDDQAFIPRELLQEIEEEVDSEEFSSSEPEMAEDDPWLAKMRAILAQHQSQG